LELTRRQFLASGSAACVICGSVPSVAHADATRDFDGCFISPPAFDRFRSSEVGFSAIVDGLFSRTRHFRSTGDAALDRDLDRALQMISDSFAVRPAFGFYDPRDPRFSEHDPERDIMNAWASAEATDIPGTWGTVAFGWDLFQEEFQHDTSGVSIIAVAAHEFAHTWQQRSGNIGRLRVGYPRKSEINADFLSGYYLGSRKLKNRKLSFKAAGELFDRLGSHSEGNDKRSHGNRKERLDAAEAGFRVAYLEGRDFSYATAAGMEYVGVG
jgi:hypothetical protein